MKKMLSISAALTLAIAALAINGCQPTADINTLQVENKKLSLSLAEAKKNFDTEKTEMQATIDTQAAKINELNKLVEQMKQTEEGYAKILIESVGELEKVKKELTAAKAQLKAAEAGSKKQAAPRKIDPAQLEALKAMQKKAAEQLKEKKAAEEPQK